MKMRRDNPKAFATLDARLKELAGVETKVGWFESATYPDGRPVAAVAAGNELGIPSRSIPARPFMRPTASEQKPKWGGTSGMLAKRVLVGKMTAVEAMDALGLVAEGDISKTIASIWAPPLSPITLMARKYREEGKKVTGATIGEIAGKIKAGKGEFSANTKPLNESGHMIATLTHITEKTT